MLALVVAVALAEEPGFPRAGELELKKQVALAYPPAARALGLADVACLARVWLGADGVPYQVEVSGCDPVFFEATRDGILQWRWWPPTVDGEPVTAQAAIRVRYVVPPAEPETPEPRFDTQYVELTVGLGALHAPADPSPQEPSPTTGLLRLWTVAGLDVVRLHRVGFGCEVDVRGFETFALHSRLLLGGNGLTRRFRMFGGAGIGLVDRGLGADATQAAFLPVIASAIATPADSFSLHARGGADLGFDGRVDPTITGGLTLGFRDPHGVVGLRIEGGWRRELGADTATVVVGMGI
jgi:hypothetical protein